MKHERRKAQILKRKNFLPTLLITILLWVAAAAFVYVVDPATLGAIPIFFSLIFLGLLFTFSLLLGNTRRGMLLSIAITLFLILRYLGVGNILNFFLIAGIGIAIEIYFSRMN